MTATSAYYEGTLSGKRTPLPNGEVAEGYYRRKLSSGWGEPVALWRGDGRLYAKEGHNPTVDITDAEQEFFAKVFSWIARHPIGMASYWQWMDTGSYPDADPLPPTIGDNSRESPDVYADQIASAMAIPAFEAPVVDEESAAAAQGLRARLNEVASEADKVREKLKKPHLDAGREVDAAWQPVIKEAKAKADMLRQKLRTYENAKAAEQPTAEVHHIKGGYGRAAVVKIKRVAVVEDWDAVYGYFSKNETLRETLQKLAQKCVENSVTVPGVHVEEERDVR